MPVEEMTHNSNSTSFILREEENPPEGIIGETKTKNDPKGQIQRDVVTYRGRGSDFTVSVEMVLCMHGWETAEKVQPMSLLVFDYRLIYTKRDRSVASVKTDFVFDEAALPSENPQDRVNRADPQVDAYAPFERAVIWNETEAEVKSQIHGDAKIGWGSGVKADVGGGGEREVSHQQKFFNRGQASRQYNNSSRRWDGVFWFLQQNDSQDHGVPSTFSVAVLLKRSGQAPFKGTFNIRLEAGVREDFKAGMRRFFSKAEDDPLIFDPSRKPEGRKLAMFEKLIDKDNLGLLARDDELTKLVKAWGADLGAFNPPNRS